MIVCGVIFTRAMCQRFTALRPSTPTLLHRVGSSASCWTAGSSGQSDNKSSGVCVYVSVCVCVRCLQLVYLYWGCRNANRFFSLLQSPCQAQVTVATAVWGCCSLL